MATEQFTEYSSTPANNISPSPVGAPPGMAPSGVRPELQEMQSVIANVGQQLATLTTFYEGTSPPTLPTGVSALPGMMWHDTSTNELRMMSQDGTTWIELGAFNETNHLFTAALAAQAATASTAAVANALSGVLGIGGGGTGASAPAQAMANLFSGFASGVLPQSLGGIGSGSLYTALNAFFQDSLGGNGYRRNTMDGFMLQWETTGVIGAQGGASVYWPTSFPNRCLFALAGRYVGDASIGGANAYGPTQNAVTVYNGSSEAAQIAILGIGY